MYDFGFYSRNASNLRIAATLLHAAGVKWPGSAPVVISPGKLSSIMSDVVKRGYGSLHITNDKLVYQAGSLDMVSGAGYPRGYFDLDVTGGINQLEKLLFQDPERVWSLKDDRGRTTREARADRQRRVVTANDGTVVTLATLKEMVAALGG